MKPEWTVSNKRFQFSDLLAQQGLPLLIIIFFLADAATKILRNNYASFYNISALAKAAFMVLALVIAIRQLTPFKKRILTVIGGLIAIYCLGTAFTNEWQFQLAIFTENAIFLGRFLLIFFLLLYFDDPYKMKWSSSTSNAFEAVILLNSLLILISAVAGLKVFETYMGSRFGYSGVFAASSMGTYFYAIAITYCVSKYRNTKTGLSLMALVVIASLFVGTKALWLFVVLSALHFIVASKVYKKPWFIVLCFASLTAAFFFRKRLLDLLASNQEITRVYQEEGFFTMLTSYRNQKAQYVYDSLISESWTLGNYLFGGTKFTVYRMEFGFLDLFLFFGLLGGTLYLFYYFTKVLRLREFLIFERIQLLFLLGIALLSGTFFNNGVIPMYLFVMIILIQKRRWKS